jgi:hypothetical protein
MLTPEITSLARAQPVPRVADLATLKDQRDKPLSDTQWTAAQSANQLSRIKTIHHSDPVTVHRCCSTQCPTPEDIQDYMDVGHYEHVCMPLGLQDRSVETTGIIPFNK